MLSPYWFVRRAQNERDANLEAFNFIIDVWGNKLQVQCLRLCRNVNVGDRLLVYKAAASKRSLPEHALEPTLRVRAASDPRVAAANLTSGSLRFGESPRPTPRLSCLSD